MKNIKLVPITCNGVMRFALLLFLCFPFFSANELYAQHRKKTKKFADELFQKGDYYNAAIYYRKLLMLDSSKAEANYNYAQALRLSNNYKRALNYYKVTYKKDRGKNFDDALFWMAEMYKRQGDYVKAKRYFKRAERYYKGNKSTYYYVKVKNEQKACVKAQQLIKKPLDVTLENLGPNVNTVNSEFSGFVLNDSIIFFSSLRTEKDTMAGEVSYMVKLYEAEKKGDEWALKSQSILNEINAETYHTTNGVFNRRKTFLFYSLCSEDNTCEIYYNSFQNGTWGPSKSAGKKINLQGYSSTHPTLGRINGDEVLFFVSNRPGGFGKDDIWYCTVYSNGEFGIPKNLGPQVNTLGNEITPFYHSSSSTLYFSSDWYEGLGGFDIFKAEGKPLEFGEVKNMGYPINSSVNDYYFHGNNKQAVLTSNRVGSFAEKSETCCNDLYIMDYELERPKEEKVLTAYDKLIDYLPLRLFFHNDEPNPRTNKVTTEKNYWTTYEKYITLLERYKKEYSRGLRGDERLDAKDEIEDFFEEEVKEGATNLRKFTVLLLEELQKGAQISLTLKGFASPLSKSDYNSNLTQRRISSIENYLKEYNGGVLRPFIQDSNLIVIQEPFGEDKSANDVSDNLNDKRNSIYSKRAAFERRVEIISVTHECDCKGKVQ